MVMPLYDDNPFKLPQTPVVSWSLIGITIVAFILEFSANDDPLVVANQFGVIPAAVSGAYSFPGALNPWLTLFSYQFLHADIVHLIGNLIFVWVFADNVEQALGRWRFLAFYLLVGAAGALAFVFSDPGSKVPLIGASGSVSGVVIAYLMLRPCAKLTALVLGIPLRISAYWIIGVFIAIQFVNLGIGDEERRRLVVPYRRHAGRRPVVPADEAARGEAVRMHPPRRHSAGIPTADRASAPPRPPR